MIRLPKFPIKGNIPIHVSISQGMSESGAPKEAATYNGNCLFDETAKTRRGGDGLEVALTGVAIVFEDIAPEIESITGHAKINGGSERKIHSARRIRDASGNVHHTELELI